MIRGEAVIRVCGSCVNNTTTTTIPVKAVSLLLEMDSSARKLHRLAEAISTPLVWMMGCALMGVCVDVVHRAWFGWIPVEFTVKI